MGTSAGEHNTARPTVRGDKSSTNDPGGQKVWDERCHWARRWTRCRYAKGLDCPAPLRPSIRLDTAVRAGRTLSSPGGHRSSPGGGCGASEHPCGALGVAYDVDGVLHLATLGRQLRRVRGLLDRSSRDRRSVLKMAGVREPLAVWAQLTP